MTGLFVNNQKNRSPSATSATWPIAQSVNAGGNLTSGQIKTFCSGTAGVTATPIGRIAFSFYVEFEYVATVLDFPTLESGRYRATTIVHIPAPPSGLEDNYVSDVEGNSSANVQGPGSEVVDDSMFTSSFFGFTNFTLANSAQVCGNIGCDEFSVGVIATATH